MGAAVTYRTAAHAAAAKAATEYLREQPEVDAVLLVGSGARRTDANDLDLSAMVSGEEHVAAVESRFSQWAAVQRELRALAEVGPFVSLDLHATAGEFAPQARGWTDGPDSFELEIGNEVARSGLIPEHCPRRASRTS